MPLRAAAGGRLLQRGFNSLFLEGNKKARLGIEAKRAIFCETAFSVTGP